MAAGNLKRRVLIRKWQDQPSVDLGVEQVFDAGTTVWASLEPVGNALFYGLKQIEAGITHLVVIRRSSRFTEYTVTGLHVVEHRGCRYRVHRVKNIDDADVYIQLDVEQIGVIT